MELEKHITDEKTGISYTLCGDYYLPDLALPEEKYYELGRFGRAKFRYLQKCHKVLLTSLRTSGKGGKRCFAVYQSFLPFSAK